MPDFVTLSCPSCGGKLNITNDIERFACGHCGNEHVVKRAGGIVSLSPVIEALKKVEVGVDKTASELAINRLQREIDELHSQRIYLITSSPKPKVSNVFAILIGGGIIIAGYSLYIFIMSHVVDNAGCGFIGISFLLLFIGALPYLNRSKKLRIWQETTGTQLSAIEKNIAQKQEDLEYHRKIVARHA